ncbi:CDP-alcohol phosphatidyltransferase family protein [Mariniblastus fucicola]|nr:CDP-alcohol phosphatidyltransferase family protein [Mariniblastus fucicola]
MNKESNADLENRRPIKSRGMKLFQFLAQRLAASSVTPNMISCSSIAFGALAGASMAATTWVEATLLHGFLWLVAAAMIQGRLIANLLDGMVAVEGGKATVTGELYNEVPDRISDTFIFVGAGFACVGVTSLGWAAAVVAVFVAYTRAIGVSVGAGQVFAGPMAKPQRMALMTVVSVVLSALTFLDADQQLQSWILNGALAIIVLFGLVTAIRRLTIIGRAMQQNSRSQS